MTDLQTIVGSIVNGALARLNMRLVFGVSKDWFHPSSPNIKHRRVVPNATYSPWLNDEQFLRVYAAIKDNTLVDIYRCYELWQLGQQCATIDGDFLEVGVWRGGTGCLLAACADPKGRTTYLADTFSGVVKAGERDTFYRGGEHADTSKDVVLQLACKMNLQRLSILSGIFPDDTAGAIPGQISLLHCDVDTYRSAADIVAWAIPRLAVGGAIVFDDYGFSGCEGTTRLVNEVHQGKRLLLVHNLNGHAILFKYGT